MFNEGYPQLVCTISHELSFLLTWWNLYDNIYIIWPYSFMVNIATLKQSCDTKFWECCVLQFYEEYDTNWFSETKVTFRNTGIKICLSVQNSECLFNKRILPQKNTSVVWQMCIQKLCELSLMWFQLTLKLKRCISSLAMRVDNCQLQKLNWMKNGNCVNKVIQVIYWHFPQLRNLSSDYKFLLQIAVVHVASDLPPTNNTVTKY